LDHVHFHDAGFSLFLKNLKPEAQRQGISSQTFQAALSGVTLDPKVIEISRRQAKAQLPIWERLAKATSPARLQRGASALGVWGSTLASLERTYGVDQRVVLGVWGMESSFGENIGTYSVIRSLATLAYTSHRKPYFRQELLGALRILDAGNISLSEMRGSWDGGMGQTQFMPTSFLQYAVSFSGDGRRNIWTNVPDALASTANYLRKHGWITGLPWGFEVRLPGGFSAWGSQNQSLSSWARMGVKQANGASLPALQASARLYFPAGRYGPVFLLTSNFDVVRKYNNSYAYALSALYLGDRLYGGSPIFAQWPEARDQLSPMEQQEIQHLLKERGYDVGEVDGRLGEQTRQAIMAYQAQQGLAADGYADQKLLRSLRGRP
jgi:lytic murein transglycosylase